MFDFEHMLLLLHFLHLDPYFIDCYNKIIKILFCFVFCQPQILMTSADGHMFMLRNANIDFFSFLPYFNQKFACNMSVHMGLHRGPD